MNETTDNLADNTTMSHLDVEKDRSQVSVLPIICDDNGFEKLDH